jgi:hypothetical protein
LKLFRVIRGRTFTKKTGVAGFVDRGFVERQQFWGRDAVKNSI